VFRAAGAIVFVSRNKYIRRRRPSVFLTYLHRSNGPDHAVAGARITPQLRWVLR
jgi:hypothetical protein